MRKSRSRSIEIYMLVMLVTVEAAAALFGGYSLMNDPTGSNISLPVELLKGTIFPNYIIPGIILFLFLGFFPLFLIFPLLFKPKWVFFNSLNIYPNYHWAWTYTLYNSIILITWIKFQIMILGTGSVIQGVSGLRGVLILIVTLLPSVKRFYRRRVHPGHHINAEK
jgi:hypothetical protein